METQPLIRPVVMSGGSGTRLWPLSRKARPKQFHQLTSTRSIFQETVLRVRADGFSAPIVLGADRHKSVIIEELEAVNIAPEKLILEPMPKNTAPAIAALAVAVAENNPEEIVVVLPADQVVGDATVFCDALRHGVEAAREGYIVTFGVKPNRPETGYGYICAENALYDGAFSVKSFEEKPDVETAGRYLASGKYFWNAGIFMFQAGAMLEELGSVCPGVIDPVFEAVRNGRVAGNALLLDAEAFGRAAETSIDYALMEQTRKAAVVPVNVPWSDIGSWAALWAYLEKDDQFNAAIGDAPISLDCNGCLTIGHDVQIATIGMENTVVVAAGGAVLVISKDQAQNVKKVVDRIKKLGKAELL